LVLSRPDLCVLRVPRGGELRPRGMLVAAHRVMSRYVCTLATLIWFALATALAAQSGAPAESPTAMAPPAVLTYANRAIVELHATNLARTPADRVAAARRVLDQVVEDGRVEPLTTRPFGSAMVVSVAGRDTFALVPGDVDTTAGETLERLAADATSRLQLALAEATELHTPARLARGTGLALLATA